MSATENSAPDEVTLQDYWRVVVAGRKIILVAIIVAALIGLALTFIRTTTYSASSQVFLGQATTVNGTPITTPPTNPATAPVVLEGDAIVGPVAKAAGLSPRRIRSGISLDIPRAPGSAGNLPTLVKVTYTGTNATVVRAVANQYAEQIVIYNSQTYAVAEKTLNDQRVRYEAEADQLRTQIARLEQQLDGGASTSRELSLTLASQRLSEVTADLSTVELSIANREQIEQPQVVTDATTVSSSTSGPQRIRTVVFAALLGAVVGLIVVFIWRRPRDEGA